MDPNSRDPYAPQYTGQWEQRAALDWDLSVWKYGYWRNELHTETAGRVPKTVGWQWELGVQVGKHLDLFRAHHSRHIMDEPGPTRDRFPVQDSYGVRIHLITGK
jgi:hypothetical protein